MILTRHCFTCAKEANYKCACCGDAYYCCKECQSVDFNRIHKYEARQDDTSSGFTAQQDGGEKNESTTMREGEKHVKEESTRFGELRVYAKNLNDEYQRIAREVQKAEAVDNQRRQRIKDRQKRTPEVAKRFEKIERFADAQEETQKWSQHDEYERTIAHLREIVNNATGRIPEIGPYEQLRMAYTKRQLSLLRMRRKLSRLTLSKRHIGAVFVLEGKIQEQNNRFIHEWLIGDAVDYDEAKKENQSALLATYTENYIDHQWEMITQSMAKEVAEILKDTKQPSNTKQGLHRLSHIKLNPFMDSCFETMDISSGAHIGVYDSMMRREYEDGEISEEVWHNSTNFFNNTYTALRARGMRLIKEMSSILRDKSGSTFGVNPVVDDEEETKNKNGLTFKEKLNSYLPNWTTLIVGGTLVITLLIALVFYFTRSCSSAVMEITTNRIPEVSETNVSSKSREWLKTVETMDKGDTVIGKAVTDTQKLEKDIQKMSLYEIHEMTDDKSRQLKSKLSHLEGMMEVNPTINSIPTVPFVNRDVWYGVASMPGYLNELGKNSLEGLEFLYKEAGGEGDILTLTIKQVSDDPLLVEYRFGMYVFIELRDKLIAFKDSKSFDEKAALFESLRKNVVTANTVGATTMAPFIGKWIGKYLSVLEPIKEMADNVATPLLVTMKKNVQVAIDAGIKAMDTVTKEETAKNAAFDVYQDALSSYGVRRLGSDLLVHCSVSSVAGFLKTVLLANGLARLALGISAQALFMYNQGLCMPDYETAFRFITSIPFFLMTFQTAIETGRVVLGARNITDSVRDTVDRIGMMALDNGKTDEFYVKIAKVIAEYDTIDAQFASLSDQTDKNNLDSRSHALLAELIASGEIKAVADKKKTIKEANPAAGVFRLLSKHYYTKIKYRADMNSQTQQVISNSYWLIEQFNNAVMYHNGAYAFLFTLYCGLTVQVPVWYTLLIGLLGAGIGYFFMVSLASVSACAFVYMLYTRLIKGYNFPVSSMFWLIALVFGSIVHPFLVQSATGGSDYETFISNYSVYSIAPLQDVLHSKHARVESTREGYDKNLKLYNAAVAKTSSIEWSPEYKTEFKGNLARIDDMITVIGNPFDQTTDTLAKVGIIMPSSGQQGLGQ